MDRDIVFAAKRNRCRIHDIELFVQNIGIGQMSEFLCGGKRIGSLS